MSLLSKFLARFSKSDRNSKGLSGKDSDVRFLGETGGRAPSNCKISLLDDLELKLDVKLNAKGQVLLEKVYEQLNLREKDYFGLRYLDQTSQTHWLDPTKSITSQLKFPPPHTFYFGVKFYAADPCKLHEEITRYQFFLQAKRDILQGRLPVAFDVATELSALSVQSELGDFDPKRHFPGYVSEFRFVPNQTEEFENRVMSIHKTMCGIVPAAAEYKFLDKVKWLDMYGVDLHPVQGEGNMEYYLGLTPTGVVVYRNKSKVGNYFWPRITKITFKAKLFMVRVRDKNNVENTYAFECVAKPACKHLWKCCVEHHAFFRLTSANESYSATGKLFSLGSKYRYSGRTERQVLEDSSNRPQPQVVRVPSRRHQRRYSAGNLSAPAGYSQVPNPSQGNMVTVVAPEPIKPASVHRREAGYQSAPDSPRSTRSAPWETSHARKGTSRGLYTSGRESPMSVRSEKMMFPKRIPSGSESEAGHARHRHHQSRLETDTESEIDGGRKHRRSRHRNGDSESEAAEAARRRHRRRGKSAENIPTENNWQGGTNNQGPYELRPNGSLTSVVHSEPGNNAQRRRRKRSKSPGKKPPEELAQHFKYIDPEAEGLTEEQLRDIPFTNVETKVDAPKVKYSPHSRHRHRPSHRRSYGELSEKSTSSRIPAGEPPPPYPGASKREKERNRRSAPNLNSYTAYSDTPREHHAKAATSQAPPPASGPEQYMRSPASVQRNETQTAPIVKTKNQTMVVFSGLPTAMPLPSRSQPDPATSQPTPATSYPHVAMTAPYNPHVSLTSTHQSGPANATPQSFNGYHPVSLPPPTTPNTSLQNTSGRDHTREDSGLGIDPENISSGSRYYYISPYATLPNFLSNGWVYDPHSMYPFTLPATGAGPAGHMTDPGHVIQTSPVIQTGPVTSGDPGGQGLKGSKSVESLSECGEYSVEGPHISLQLDPHKTVYHCSLEHLLSQMVPSPGAPVNPSIGMTPSSGGQPRPMTSQPLPSYKVITKPAYVEQVSSEDRGRKGLPHTPYSHPQTLSPPPTYSPAHHYPSHGHPPPSSRQPQSHPAPTYSHPTYQPPPSHMYNGGPGYVNQYRHASLPPQYSQPPQQYSSFNGAPGGYPGNYPYYPSHSHQRSPQKPGGYVREQSTGDSSGTVRSQPGSAPQRIPVRTHSEKMTEL